MREDDRLPTGTVVQSGQRVATTTAIHEVQQRINGHVSSPLAHAGEKILPSVTRVISTSRDLHVFLQAYQRRSSVVRRMRAVGNRQALDDLRSDLHSLREFGSR